MFGNLSAQAGVISNALNNSPNIIQPTITWNFNDVIVFDFLPTDEPNINNRPRLNVWRGVEGEADLDYLLYVDAGNQLLSPAPTGFLTESDGSPIGSYIFPKTSIIGDKIIAGVDLFTHPFTVVNTTPPLSEWTINSTNVIGEVQYQYKFKVGEKNPQININVSYKPDCNVSLPNCFPGQAIAFIGVTSNNCPIYQCRSIVYGDAEIGPLYADPTSWSSGQAGLARQNNNIVGYWFINSGSGSFRNIINSNQNGRTPIPNYINLQPVNNAFFIVGPSGGNNKHLVNYILYDNVNLKTVPVKNTLSLDANYSWFGGERNIYFYTGFKTSNFDDRDFLYKISHTNSFGDSLNFERKNIGNYSSRSATITGNVFNKGFNYEFTNLGTGFLFEVRPYGLSRNVIFSDLVTGTSQQFTDSVYSVRGLGFEASLNFNVLSTDWFNYGMFFNNIYLANKNIIPYPVFDGGNWRNIALQAGSQFINYYVKLDDPSTYPGGLSNEQRTYIESLASNKKCMSGCWLYPINLPKNQTVWRDSALLVNNTPNAMFNSNSCLAISNDGKYQTVLSYNNRITNLNYKITSGYIWKSNDYGVNWASKVNNQSNNWQSICMNGNGQYQSAIISPEIVTLTNPTDPVWAYKFSYNKIRTGLLIYNSTDYGETWTPQNFNQYSGVWKKIITNDQGNMKVVISNQHSPNFLQNNPNMLISYNSGITWVNYFFNQYQNNTSFNDIAMSKDGKYLIACTNVFDRFESSNANPPRVYFSSNSGQTWRDSFLYEPIYFDKYNVRTGGSETVNPGEVFIKNYGNGFIAYIHHFTLDNKPSIWRLENLGGRDRVIFRNVDNPDSFLEGRYLWVGEPSSSQSNVTTISFQKTSSIPTPVFDGTNNWYVSKLDALPILSESAYTYPYDCAGLSSDGKVQVLIDRETKNFKYPGILVSHNYGETWQIASYPFQYASPNICARALQIYRFSFFQHSVSLSNDGKYQFINNLWYSENSGITWSNNKIGEISQLGWNGLPADIKLSSGANTLAIARRDFIPFFSTDSAPFSNNVYNIDNFFEIESALPPAPVLFSSAVGSNGFTVNWNNIENAIYYIIDVSLNSSFVNYVNDYENKIIYTNNITLINLSPSTIYYVRVRALTNNGFGSNSSTLIQATSVGPPSAPDQPTTTNVTDTSFTINWNSVSTATSYRLDVSLTNEFTSFIAGFNNLTVNGTSQNLTSLQPNTTYWFRVRAVSAAGTSNNSPFGGRVTAPAAPNQPTFTNITSSSFRANWNASTGALQYRIDVSTNSSFTNFVPGFSDAFTENTFIDVTGLSSSSTYYVRVRAVANFQTISNNSPNGVVTVLSNIPSAPNQPTANNVTNTSFTANWNSVDTATSYRLDVATNSSFTSFVAGYNNLTVNGTSQSVTGLTSNTTYYIRVRAVNSAGTSASSTSRTVTTALPPPNLGLGEYARSQNSIIFNWNVVTTSQSHTYLVDLSTSSSFSNFVEQNRSVNYTLGGSEFMTTTFNNLINVTYYIRIRTQNANGTSLYSNTVTIPPVP